MRYTLICIAVVCTCPLLVAQEAERSAFIVRLGIDTVAVERLTRTAGRLEGRCVVRTPRTVVRDYTVTLRPDGSADRFEMGDAVVEFTGDRAGAIPFVANCWGLLELAARRFRATGGDSLRQVALTPGREVQRRTITVQRRGADSLTATVIEGLPYRVAVDRAGRIRGASWAGEWTVERVPSLDLERLAAEFERRPLGPLSPADSVRATIAGATVTVQYSRPKRRGRTVFGGVVPWNEVWRTGANEATLLTTTADLEMGGTVVPAGSYTLWTLPRPSGWTLIINRNTGQWGTDYGAQHDLARLDMRVERLSAPVEQFTIALEPQGDGAGILKLEWDHTRAGIAFTPKQAAGR